LPAFQYVALNPQGKEIKGILEADSARQLRQTLRDQALTPMQVEPSNKQFDNDSNQHVFSLFTPKLKALDRVLFTRQLSTLLASSMPIEESLNAIAQQNEKQSNKALIMGIRSRVLEGNSLAQSLLEYPSSFSNLYCSSVAAGEQSGFLDQVLDNLSNYLEREHESYRNVEMALMYPIILLIVAFVIVGALMVYVLPDMIDVIENTGQTLPWATTLLISVTELLKSFWWVLLCGILALSLFIRGILNREKARLIWDAYKFSLPIIGKIIRSSNSARFSNTLSILTKSGIPLVDAMKIASEVVANKALQKDLRTATQDVVEGKSLRESLENISHFPPMMMHMIGSGEQSGELDQMLARIAEYQQAEVERLVSTLVKLFEPAMMIIMGGTVLFIVMAVLLPILSMNQIV
jgi:general secretion pathway protein F